MGTPPRGFSPPPCPLRLTGPPPAGGAGGEGGYWVPLPGGGVAPAPGCGRTEGDFKLREPEWRYKEEIASCLESIRDGQSYELCLTTQLRAKRGNLKGLPLYLRLRRTNPAPFACYLRLSDELEIVCCSPERFVKVDAKNNVECKPIKGTRKRGRTGTEDEALKHDLATCEKDSAENIMIVDLMRNDLSRICVPGSVKVPKLTQVETYSTVHQLVSTVTGKLKQGCTAIQCMKSIFPPGSMTGAPKIRSMEILESLECGPRGIYSGCIGYFAFSGAADFNVVIRTAVLAGDSVSIGAGGAIVALSDIQEEFEEMMLKAKALLEAIRGERHCWGDKEQHSHKTKLHNFNCSNPSGVPSVAEEQPSSAAFKRQVLDVN